MISTHNLVKGIIFGTFVAIVLSIGLSACTRSTVKNAVEESAREYVKEMGMEWIGGSSTGQDSDGDGYVSIDVRAKDTADKQVKMLYLECSYSYVGFETGCKKRLEGVKVR